MARKRNVPNESWTVKEIVNWLENLYETSIRPRVSEYAKSVKEGFESDPKIEKAIRGLQKSGTGKQRSDYRMFIGTRKRKADLLKQTRKVRSFEKLDIDTDTAKKFQNEKMERAYQSFKKNHDSSMSRQEYKRLADMFGSVGSMLEMFGYERHQPIDRKRDRKRKKEPVTPTFKSDPATNQTLVGNLQDYNNQGYTGEQVLDAMKKVLEKGDQKGWTTQKAMKELDKELRKQKPGLDS